MSKPSQNMPCSINALSAPKVQFLLDNASSLRLAISKMSNGTTIIDGGIKATGGLAAGCMIAEICLGGMGKVSLRATSAEHWSWYLDVHTWQPIIACLASQYAGWILSHGDAENTFNVLGSGPARAIGSKEDLFTTLNYRDTADSACLVLETDTMPPLEISATIAECCNISPSQLTLILTPTTSLCGSVQIVSRVLETALHKAHTLGFDLQKIIDGVGSAPLCPPTKDFLTAMSRTNDAILFAGKVQLFVQANDADAQQLADKLPSCTSVDYGQPFAEIFKNVAYDFYKIDPLLFSPAQVTVTALESGNSFHAGKIDLQRLHQSFSKNHSAKN